MDSACRDAGQRAPVNAISGVTTAVDIRGFTVQAGGEVHTPRITLLPFPAPRLPMLRTALSWVDEFGRLPRCVGFFRSIGNGATVEQLKREVGLLSWSPSLPNGDWGVQLAGMIVLSDAVFRAGLTQVVLTIIHELAHVSGAGAEFNAVNDRWSHARAWEAELRCVGHLPYDFDVDQLRDITSFAAHCGTCRAGTPPL